MTFFPQEAKEQIATLMADVERLETQKEEIFKQMKANKDTSIQKADKYNTMMSIFYGVIAVLVILLAYTYIFGPIIDFDKDEKASYALYVKSIEQQNMKYRSDIDKLKEKLKQGGTIEKSRPSLLYKVQIGAFKSFELETYDSKKGSITEKNESGMKKYALGSFTNYKDALKFKNEVKKMGFKTAFIRADYKGQSVTVKEALKIEMNR